VAILSGVATFFLSIYDACVIVDSIAHFQKQFAQNPRSVLILSKELGEQQEALKAILSPVAIRFNKENFDPKTFITEYESRSFLVEKRMIVVEEVEKLKSELFEGVIEAPQSDVTLVFVGESFPSKLIEKMDLVLKYTVKKPYEKEAEMSAWMVQRAKEEGVRLSLDVANIWVKSFGMEKPLLEKELDKLLCNLGYSGEITLALVREFSITLPHLTLWQLGDAIFGRSRKEAWQVLHTLLEEGSSLYQILSNLRGQFEAGLKQLAAHKRGRLCEEFPYLKGSLAHKKVALLGGFGQNRLVRGLSLLFEAELRAKNETVTAEILLEPLLVRLTA